jgi:hypothetical protein
MKNIIKLTIAVILILFITPEIFGAVRPADPVGVPLDGGLLAILAGAGLAYYTARSKKRKNKE